MDVCGPQGPRGEGSGEGGTGRLGGFRVEGRGSPGSFLGILGLLWGLSWHFVAALRCSMSVARSFGREICKVPMPRNPQNQAFSLRGSSFLRVSIFCVRSVLRSLLAVILTRFGTLFGLPRGLLGSFEVPFGGLLGLLGGHLSALRGSLWVAWELLGAKCLHRERPYAVKRPQSGHKTPQKDP